MSKPIINGIDVSEWELKGVLIPITECKYFKGIGDCKESKGLCVANDNCYYQQLKRLQEKNEELKDRCKDYLKQLNALKPENKLLHKEIKNYKQALEEIRDIVSDEINKTDADDELMQIYGTIYNRCNEVLNDNRD